MAVHTAISEGEARTILAAYPIEHLELLGIEGVAGGSVNSNFALTTASGRLFLRVYEEQGHSGAEHETALLERLAGAGVPTPPPLRRRDGGFVSGVRGKPVALFPWRDGTMRCQASVGLGDVRQVGEALARIHVAGQKEAPYPGRFEFPDLMQRLDRIEREGGPEWAPVAPSLRTRLQRAHAARDIALPRGVIHGDLFRDQVLWRGDGAIAALLDFESACDGTFAFDLMVTVLSWCVGDDLDGGLARAMVEGYQQVRALSQPEQDALMGEGSFAALRFAITRITDFSMRARSADGRPKPPARDWQRFMKRFDKLQALGSGGVREALGL
jgi:homoserine kinase type II